MQILVCPLYAKLSPQDQAKAFIPTPPRTRKVILATNVAETSVTIPGVKFVVDSGLAKEKEYHAAVGAFRFLVEPISVVVLLTPACCRHRLARHREHLQIVGSAADRSRWS